MNAERIVFVHGAGRFGAAAWPAQHGLALNYDALFVRRHGYGANTEPAPTDFAEDARIIREALGDGGHLVAHSQGAIGAMMTAVEHPALVHSLVLAEPGCFSLTAELPATAAHKALLESLTARGMKLSDAEFAEEYSRLMFGEIRPRATGRTGAVLPPNPQEQADAQRLRLQAAPWTAPLHIVPGVPTLVLTGGWEPVYEEVAEYLRATGAVHRVTPGGHRPQDTPEGAALIRAFIANPTPSGLAAPKGRH